MIPLQQHYPTMFLIIKFITVINFVPVIHSSFIQQTKISNSGTATCTSSSFYHTQNRNVFHNYPRQMKNTHTCLEQKKTSHHVNNNEEEGDNHDEVMSSLLRSTPSSSLKRRLFLSTLASTTTATALLTTTTQIDNANALSFFGGGNSNTPRKAGFSIISNRANSTSATAMRQPMKEPSYDKQLVAESCLLGLLPTKNKEFRTLEKEILKVSVLREKGWFGSIKH